MVVNEPTASRAAFLQRTVVTQLTVDKLNKELPRWKGERFWRGKATAPATARRLGMASGIAQALRNLQPRRCSIACRVFQARCRLRAMMMWRRRSAAWSLRASWKINYGYRRCFSGASIRQDEIKTQRPRVIT